MRVLYDTSVAIALRDGDASIVQWHETENYDAAISAVTMVELEGGVGRGETGRDVRRLALDALYDNFDVLDFTAREAAVYGAIVAGLGFARSKITDRMIAATAIAAGLSLATLNERDFRDIPKLRLIGWSE